MYLKYIRCTVPPDRREVFSRAQRAWAVMEDAPGFIAQCGGWEIDAPGEAHILAGWRSQADLEQFMREGHDEIFQGSGQAETYTTSEVLHYEWMPGKGHIPALFAGYIRENDFVFLRAYKEEELARMGWFPAHGSGEFRLEFHFCSGGKACRDLHLLNVVKWRGVRLVKLEADWTVYSSEFQTPTA